MSQSSSSSSFQRCVIATTQRVLICFSLLRICEATASFSNMNLLSPTLDPLTTGFTVKGDSLNQLGFSVSTAGDINNDGYSDIIVGGRLSNRAYVIYGGEKSLMLNIDLFTLLLSPLTTGFIISGDGYVGQSVSTAGDINKDGYDDIIIGAYGKNSFQGAAYVIYGGEKSSMSTRDLDSNLLNPLTSGFMITASSLYPISLGFSVSTAGDINNDGYSDVIVGAPVMGSQVTRGAAYVIYGEEKSKMQNIDLSTQTLDPLTTGFKILGKTNEESFGQSVGTVGDINKDGYSDIFVGAYGVAGDMTVYVIYGGEKSKMQNIDLSTQTLDPLTTGFIIKGYFLSSANTAGDINNDGYSDIIVGASQSNTVYVIYGGEKSKMQNINLQAQTLDPLTTGFTIRGESAGSNDLFGFSVSTAGDINNDGYIDIIIGASGISRAYVIYGGEKSAMLDLHLNTNHLDPLTTGFAMWGAGELGSSVSTAGDINGDGSSDIIVGAPSMNTWPGEVYIIYTCSSCSKCPGNCTQCNNPSVCTKCKSPYLLYNSECLDYCPVATFASTNTCEDCPSHCVWCISKDSCRICDEGYTLSNSLCVLSSDSPSSPGSPLSPDVPLSPESSLSLSSKQAQEKATQAISSGAKAIGSVICVSSATFPVTALVSKTVQSTRYLNLSVTSDLAGIYQTWKTDMIPWQVPKVLSDKGQFKTSPFVFAQYELDSPFLTNFWPTLLNIGIGFTTFISCLVIQKLFEQAKYEGWAYSLLQKLVAGSFNFALVQAYACLDDILFYLMLDIKTNPFKGFFSWASFIIAIIFLAIGCLLVFFNFWTVKKYQDIKKQGLAKQNMKDLDAFNERNKYWELFYSDFDDGDLWSQSFFAILIIRSALSSLIITLVYEYPSMQTSYLVITDGAIILFMYFKTPFRTPRAKIAQYYYEIITLTVHICTFILSIQDTMKTPSETLKIIISTGIIYLNTALVSGSIGFMFIELYKTIRHKSKAAKRRQIQKISEDTQETQNLTRTTSPEAELRQRQNQINREKAAPIEKFYLGPGTNQNGNTSMSGLNMESSQILESSFNHDNLILSDMNSRNRIDRMRGRKTRPIVIQDQPRILKQRKQKSKSRNISQVRNARQFENA